MFPGITILCTVVWNDNWNTENILVTWSCFEQPDTLLQFSHCVSTTLSWADSTLIDWLIKSLLHTRWVHLHVSSSWPISHVIQTPGITYNAHFTIELLQVTQTPFTGPWRNLKNPLITFILDLCLSKPQAGKYHDYRNIIIFQKLCFQNVFYPN